MKENNRKDQDMKLDQVKTAKKVKSEFTFLTQQQKKKRNKLPKIIIGRRNTLLKKIVNISRFGVQLRTSNWMLTENKNGIQWLIFLRYEITLSSLNSIQGKL